MATKKTTGQFFQHGILSIAKLMTYHWWFKTSGTWVPYTCNDSAELEHAHSLGLDHVELQSGMVSVAISDRSQQSAGEQHSILRGLWYFEKSNGSMSPYPEDFASELEAWLLAPECCTMVAVDKLRSVRRSHAGSFEQVRSGTGKIRRVIRGFLPSKGTQQACGRDASSENAPSAAYSDLEVVGVRRTAERMSAGFLDLDEGDSQARASSPTPKPYSPPPRTVRESTAPPHPAAAIVRSQSLTYEPRTPPRPTSRHPSCTSPAIIIFYIILSMIIFCIMFYNIR
jgi:hypothetical protein